MIRIADLTLPRQLRMHDCTLRQFLTASLLAFTALLAALAASADTLPAGPEGMEVYILILRPGASAEPDVTSVGGVVLRSDGDRRLIAVPPGNADALEQHERVAALQSVWMGQSRTRMERPPITAQADHRTITEATGEPYWQRTYSYDGSGNVIVAGGDRFAYDLAGRIASSTVGNATETYGYDASETSSGRRARSSPSTRTRNARGNDSRLLRRRK